MTETLDPTTTSTKNAVANPSNAIDGDPATFAAITAATVGTGARIDVGGFSAGTIDPLLRSKATVRVRGTFASPDREDAVRLWVSKNNGSSFVILDTKNNPDGWNNGTPTTLEFDVTGLLGTASPSQFVLRVVFGNGSPFDLPDLEVS